MTTPSINTPYGVIGDALLDCGRLQTGEEPTPEQLAEGLRRLRDLINFFQTKGLKLWVNEDITVPLTTGTASYTFKTGGTVDMVKPLRVLEAFYLYDTTLVRRPLTVMALKDYWQLGQAGTAAAYRQLVTQYLVEKQATQLKVTFWPTPNDEDQDNGDVHLLMQTQITNPASLTETMNFPEEWRIALRWGLADDWATGQPQAIMDRCQQRAEMYRTALEDWDVEDAPTSYAPDARMGNPGSFT